MTAYVVVSSVFMLILFKNQLLIFNFLLLVDLNGFPKSPIMFLLPSVFLYVKCQDALRMCIFAENDDRHSRSLSMFYLSDLKILFMSIFVYIVRSYSILPYRLDFICVTDTTFVTLQKAYCCKTFLLVALLYLLNFNYG